MPSKRYNGNSPLGSTRLDGASGLAQAELEIAQRTPLQSMTTGRMQLPNGTMHVPKRGRGGGDTNPWKVTLQVNDSEDYEATILEGVIYDGLLNLTKLEFEVETVDGVDQSVGQKSVVVANDVVCIKYTYPTDEDDATLEFEVVAAGDDFDDWEITIENEEDPPEVIASRFPLAKVLESGDLLETEQIAYNHLAKVVICVNGGTVTSFTPI